MDTILSPITGFFETANFVYVVEIIVAAAIIVLLLYIFYQLGLLKKEQ